jgi:hypothetical protein
VRRLARRAGRALAIQRNFDRPTFTPSLHIASGCKASGWKPGEECWCTYNERAVARGEKPCGFRCRVCHLHVTDGELRYCPDSTHELAGKVVPMKDADADK